MAGASRPWSGWPRGDGRRQRDGEPRRHGRQRRPAAHRRGASTRSSARCSGCSPATCVALASLILLGGALGDRFGRRKVFVIGTVWFAAASLLCGAAPNIEVLVARACPAGRRWRAAHARAAWRSCRRAFASPTAPRRSARGRVWAVWPARSGRSSAAGWSTDRAGGGRSSSTCRSPRSRSSVHACGHPGDRAIRTRGRALDLVGAALAVVGLAASTWALTEAGPRGWTDTAVARRRRRSPSSAIAAFVRRMLHTRRSAGAARAVPQPHVHRRQPADRAAVQRARGVVLPGVVRAAGRRGLVGASKPASRCLPATGADAAAVLAARARSLSGSARGCSSPSVRCSPPPVCCCSPRIGPDASWVSRRVARRSRVRSRPRHVRRAADRDGDGCRRPEPRERGVGSQQRHRPSRQPQRASAVIPVVSGSDRGRQRGAGHPRLPAADW